MSALACEQGGRGEVRKFLVYYLQQYCLCENALEFYLSWTSPESVKIRFDGKYEVPWRLSSTPSFFGGVPGVFLLFQLF